jgi:Xaa-Pro aminopeptidase
MAGTDELVGRLGALRAQMESAEIQAFLVPRADRHQNEYVTAADERLAFISGFSGSAGAAVITRNEAALFTDGRYLLQAENQTLGEAWRICNVIEGTPTKWLLARLGEGGRVGFDPELHTERDIEAMSRELAKRGVGLVPLHANPIDTIWTNRPAAPAGNVEIYALELAGEPVSEKLARVRRALRVEGCDGLLISALDSLAWAFNIRGSDLEMTPFVFGLALIPADGTATLFVEAEKIDEPTARALAKSADLRIVSPAALPEALSMFASKRLRLDEATASVWWVTLARTAGAQTDMGKDPILAIKAAKNAVEVAGMRAAHIRDGAALVRFLKWFDTDRPDGCDEWTAAEQIGRCRATLDRYRGPCFSTISACAENAAQAHYRVQKDKARKIGDGEIYLFDCGGQFLDGTTDVTRVTVSGAPTEEMRLRYTQVLKGHIALCRQRFPLGVTGAQLDSLARQFLWAGGLDFDHGVGHGVGHYLSVHEGPQSISVRGAGVALVPGMVVSIEPGYYKRGAFGIRIENLAVVRLASVPPPLAEKVLLEFEMLTFVPYERRLIALELLTPEEVAWIDSYHEATAATLATSLTGNDLEYLKAATRPLGSPPPR